MHDSRQIKFAAIISYFSIVFNVLAGLIYTPWMISLIGESDYGLYTLAMSLIGLFAIDFGLGAAVSRFISKYRAQGDEKKVENFLGITFRLYLIIDIIIFICLLVVFLLIDNIYVELTVSEIQKLKVIYAISALFTTVSFPLMPLNGIIISFEKLIFYKSLDLIQKVMTILLMIFALILNYGLYSLVIVNVIVGILLLIIKIIFIKKYIPCKINLKYKDSSMFKEIFSFSTWSTITAIFQRLILNITPSLLGIFSGTTHIAIFSIGMTIESYAYTFSSALSGLFLPKVTNIIYDNDTENHKRVEDLMIKVGRVQLFIIGLILSIFIVVGREFVILWMGDNFQTSYIVALFLIFPLYITVTQEIASTMLVALNKIKYDTYSVVISGCASFVLSVVLTPKFGVIGASCSIFLGNVIGKIIYKNIIYRKVLGIDMKRFFIECHLKMLTPVILTIICGILFSRSQEGINFILFLIKCAVLFMIYCVLMWYFAFNKSEKEMLTKYIFFLTFNKSKGRGKYV